MFFGKTEAIPIVEIMAPTAEASDRQRLHAERFAEALAIFHTADWVKAAVAFEELQKAFPDDGPTRFYIARCKAYLGGTTEPPDNPRVIKMDAK